MGISTRMGNTTHLSQVVFRLLPLVVLLGGVWPADADGPRRVIDDQQIRLAVDRALIMSDLTGLDLVEVEARNGIIRLSGTVDNELMRERAEEIAGSIKGVRAVVNTVAVEPEQRNDEEIRKDVIEVLEEDPATDAYEITVAVNNGHVTLSGRVETWAEKQLSTQVAKSVKGVKEVRNDLTIVYRANRPDNELKAEIERRLGSDIWVDDGSIRVNVRSGKATLTGSVGSVEEKARAERHGWVSGVTAVDADGLKVQRWARDTMRRKEKYAVKSDGEIRMAVRDALQYDPRIPAERIGVQVSRAVVTLFGIVDDLKAKQAAVRDAENTVGVWRVKNLIKVRPQNRPDDPELTKRVEKALSRNPVVDRYDIKVLVRNGKVSLNGYVDSLFERTQAEKTVSDVKGVVEVVNNLEFDPTPSGQQDEEIWLEIRQELWWSPRLYNKNIRISVEGGVATLTGTVDTIQERRLAAGKAFGAGAKRVRNQLAVRFAPGFPSA